MLIFSLPLSPFNFVTQVGGGVVGNGEFHPIQIPFPHPPPETSIWQCSMLIYVHSFRVLNKIAIFKEGEGGIEKVQTCVILFKNDPFHIPVTKKAYPTPIGVTSFMNVPQGVLFYYLLHYFLACEKTKQNTFYEMSNSDFLQ